MNLNIMNSRNHYLSRLFLIFLVLTIISVGCNKEEDDIDILGDSQPVQWYAKNYSPENIKFSDDLSTVGIINNGEEGTLQLIGKNVSLFSDISIWDVTTHEKIAEYELENEKEKIAEYDSDWFTAEFNYNVVNLTFKSVSTESDAKYFIINVRSGQYRSPIHILCSKEYFNQEDW